jgi:hypothetical protein
VGEDNRRLWAEWVATQIGGDEARRRIALDAAMQALKAGRSPDDASAAARAAAGAPAMPYVPYAQPGVMRCRFCGSTPAVAMTVYEHNGYLILMTFKNVKGPFCHDCGLHVWRQMTNSTLLRGWLGVFSFFIAPVTALVNLINLRKLTSLPAPEPGSSVRPPADPGPGLFQRPGVYVYMGVIFVVLLIYVIPAFAGR